MPMIFSLGSRGMMTALIKLDIIDHCLHYIKFITLYAVLIDKGIWRSVITITRAILLNEELIEADIWRVFLFYH